MRTILAGPGGNILPGDEIEVDDDFGQSLIDGQYADMTEEAEVEAEDEELSNDFIEDIVEAIALLEEGNEEHWTTIGRPEVKALKAILDRKVTAADRDAAWLVYQEKEKGNE